MPKMSETASPLKMGSSRMKPPPIIEVAVHCAPSSACPGTTGNAAPKAALSRLRVEPIALYLMLGPGTVRSHFGLSVVIRSSARLGVAAVAD